MVDAEHSINRLTGEWQVRMKFNMEGGGTAQGRGTASARSIALGRGVQIELKGDLEGVGSYVEHNIVAFDPEEQMVHHFSVTSLGIVHCHTGRFEGEKSMTLRWKGTTRGLPAEEEITVSMVSEDQFTIRQVDRIEGAVFTIGEYEFLRSGRKVLEEPVPSFA